MQLCTTSPIAGCIYPILWCVHSTFQVAHGSPSGKREHAITISYPLLTCCHKSSLCRLHTTSQTWRKSRSRASTLRGASGISYHSGQSSFSLLYTNSLGLSQCFCMFQFQFLISRLPHQKVPANSSERGCHRRRLGLEHLPESLFGHHPGLRPHHNAHNHSIHHPILEVPSPITRLSIQNHLYRYPRRDVYRSHVLGLGFLWRNYNFGVSDLLDLVDGLCNVGEAESVEREGRGDEETGQGCCQSAGGRRAWECEDSVYADGATSFLSSSISGKFESKDSYSISFRDQGPLKLPYRHKGRLMFLLKKRGGSSEGVKREREVPPSIWISFQIS